jgi:exonuclease VII large subunit
MTPPASPEAGTNAAWPETRAETDSQPLPTDPTPPVSSGVPASPTLTELPEQMQAHVDERLRTLELQLLMSQQRHRDQMEEELHKMWQHLATTAQEYRQHHQTMSAALRETIEELRKELSDTLQRLSRDTDRALRQSEAHNKRAVDTLRDEMFQVLYDRDQTTVKRQILGELLIALGKQLQASVEDSNP